VLDIYVSAEMCIFKHVTQYCKSIFDTILSNYNRHLSS